MAGIYIHIPFCKSRCLYCDFYSTTRLDRQKAYIESLLSEIVLRRDYLNCATIESVYIGGGTPSVLDTADIERLLKTIESNFEISTTAEITMEGNPGDLTADKLHKLKEAGVNRLSIGIQSFQDRHLKLLGRRHDAATAIRSVAMAKEAGFWNISIDLIYGIPQQTMEELRADLETALSLSVGHISCYNLTFEDGTALTRMLASGTVDQQDEQTLCEMAEVICRTLTTAGYIRYEVSNYCKPNLHSHHNSAYWHHIPYMGAGAAAHSFDGKSRQWNVSDLDEYISGIQARNLRYEKEVLTQTDIYNEKVMLRLRLGDGIDLDILSKEEKEYCLSNASQFIDSGKLILADNHLRATEEGFHILDYITRKLIIEN